MVASLASPSYQIHEGFGIATKAENVRTLGEIMSDGKATEHFLQSGYDHAIQYLALAKPDLVSPLFRLIDDVTERLKRLSFYEVEEIRAGKQPGQKRALEELATIAGQIWRRVSDEDNDDERETDES